MAAPASSFPAAAAAAAAAQVAAAAAVVVAAAVAGGGGHPSCEPFRMAGLKGRVTGSANRVSRCLLSQ